MGRGRVVVRDGGGVVLSQSEAPFLPPRTGLSFQSRQDRNPGGTRKPTVEGKTHGRGRVPEGTSGTPVDGVGQDGGPTGPRYVVTWTGGPVRGRGEALLSQA